MLVPASGTYSLKFTDNSNNFVGLLKIGETNSYTFDSGPPDGIIDFEADFVNIFPQIIQIQAATFEIETVSSSGLSGTWSNGSFVSQAVFDLIDADPNGVVRVQGLASDDILTGQGNNSNIFTGLGGNDVLNGDAGNDTAAYLSNQSVFSLALGKDSISITDRNGSEGTDTLVNIENLAFADKTLDLNAFSSLTQLNDTQFKALAEMYVAYFNRAPDAEGLFYWADKLAEGQTLDQIAEKFFDQDETRAIYTDPSNTDAFVKAVYANVLGRTPDADGSAFWTGKLDSNEVTKGAFVLKIIQGAKNGGGAADVAYLSDKTDLGIYFSAIKGMSDGADGKQVMATFGDQATSNKTGAKTAIDGHYADATTSGGGEFLFNLVGIVDNPFADVV